MAHEKKAKVVADACAGLSIKAAVAAKLDCTATGTATDVLSTPGVYRKRFRARRGRSTGE